jgi:hypothetical protein
MKTDTMKVIGVEKIDEKRKITFRQWAKDAISKVVEAFLHALGWPTSAEAVHEAITEINNEKGLD